MEKQGVHLDRSGNSFWAIYIFLFTLLGSGGLLSILSQDVVEVKQTKITHEYLTVMEQVNTLRGQDPAKAIGLLGDLLAKTDSRFERFQIIFWELPALYCELGKFREGFDVLKNGQQEGFFYPFMLGENKFPPHVGHFENFADFSSFLAENKRLRSEEQQKANFEYIVRTPKNYLPEKKYPLLMVLCGGFGSHLQQTLDWRSPKLESEYIVAYLQGDQCQGSFLRSYQRENVDQMVAAYRQIAMKYSVDSGRVFIGAQSAGAHHSLKLMLEELIPVKGVILAFPGTPQLDEALLKKAAERVVKISILAGENDPRIIRTKEMAVTLDKCGLPNRFIVFSEKGHEFPDDFPKQIDLSLAFIDQ